MHCQSPSPSRPGSSPLATTVTTLVAVVTVAATLLAATPAQAEILAMLNYESKPGEKDRREGIAVIDVDPASKTFAKQIMDIPLPPDLVAHHIFYNPDVSKAYITALGASPLQVMDLRRWPWRVEKIAVPACRVGEDVAFSADGQRWYLTCMGSSNVIVGDAKTDQPLQEIKAAKGNAVAAKTAAKTDGKDMAKLVIEDPGNAASKSASKSMGNAATATAKPPSKSAPPGAGQNAAQDVGKDAYIQYPHGIGLAEGIDRILVTSTVNPANLKDAGETVTVIAAREGRILSTHKLADKPSPTGVAPVEAVFLPREKVPLAYITNMFGGTLWTAAWDAGKKSFDFRQAFDFATQKQGVPLEIYFNGAHNRLYVTTAKPGALHVFDIGADRRRPKPLHTIPTAAGAHHVAFSPDGRYAFVQNSFLNLPEMSDGSISVVDLKAGKKVADIDTLKRQGYNPNCIILLPVWYRPAD
jgi:DNA-binding beta-propeller fold protein YncE